MELRPYQETACHKLTECLEQGESSTILALPTGSGKTLTACKWLKEKFLDKGKSVLWWAHRIELLQQAERTFRREVPGVQITSWTADSKDASGQVVLAMILSSRELDRRFDCVVIDEGHHAAMPTYENKREEIDAGFTLLLTATPHRLDGRQIDAGSIAYQASVLDLVADGWLAKPIYVQVRTGQQHQMRVQAGDFSGRSLRQLDNEERNNLVASVYAVSPDKWGKTLVFCASIDHAEHLQQAMVSRGTSPDKIWCVHSKISPAERREFVAAFMVSADHVMINVGVFTEGFDAPDIKSIFMARPTASEVLYLQMVGRGTRRLPDKGEFYVVDFVDQLGKYTLLSRTWAQEHLGWEDPEAAAQEQRRQQAEAARRIMREANVPEREINHALVELDIMAGVVRYWTALAGRTKVRVIDEGFWNCWQKLQIIIAGRKDQKVAQLMPNQLSDVIKSSWALTGASTEGIEFKDWMDFAWAVFFQSINRNDKGWINFDGFRPIVLNVREMGRQIGETLKYSNELNEQYNDVHKSNELRRYLNDEIGRYTRFSNIITGLKYFNQVLTIWSDRNKDSIHPKIRGDIRNIIQAKASDAMDVDIQLIMHWA